MINVTKTYLPNKEKYKKYIDEIYENGWLTNNGPLVQRLEKRLAQYLGVKNIVLVSNGTIALEIAYKALNLTNEVITTPFSFVATTSSLVMSNLKPVFADIDEKAQNQVIENILGEEGLKRSVVIAAPADSPHNLRITTKFAAALRWARMRALLT